MGVGAEIKSCAKKKGLTLKELAKKADIPFNTIYSITSRDSNRINKEILKKMQCVLEISDEVIDRWKRKSPKIDPSDSDFGGICVCAVRYSIGRRTYMPGLVQCFIRSYLPYIDDVTLSVMEKDMTDAERFGGYGDDAIDKPGWLKFLDEVRKEIKRRCGDGNEL